MTGGPCRRRPGLLLDGRALLLLDGRALLLLLAGLAAAMAVLR